MGRGDLFLRHLPNTSIATATVRAYSNIKQCAIYSIHFQIPIVSCTTAGDIDASVVQLVCKAGFTLTSINHTWQETARCHDNNNAESMYCHVLCTWVIVSTHTYVELAVEHKVKTEQIKVAKSMT